MHECERDVYCINNIFDIYYPYINSIGATLYLYLSTLANENGSIEVTITDIQENTELSQTCIRKYITILSFMRLLQVQYVPFTKGDKAYKFKKMTIILYTPLNESYFWAAVKDGKIPSREFASGAYPAIKSLRSDEYEEILEKLKRELNIKANITPVVLKDTPFHRLPGPDIYKLEKLLNVYHFISKKVIIFYLYLYRHGLKDSDTEIYILRKDLKKDLMYGDEQIRIAMFILVSIKLISFTVHETVINVTSKITNKYYKFTVHEPRSTLDNLKMCRFKELEELLPKKSYLQKKYIKIYIELREILRREQQNDI